MKEFILDLNSINDISNFIIGIKNIPCDITASYENQIVDAKSYLGLVSISTHPITVNINTDNPNYIEIFSHICKRYLRGGDNMINLDAITIQDCLELYMKDIRVILNDDKVINFGERE